MKKKKTKVAEARNSKKKIVYIDVSNLNHCNFVSFHLFQHSDSVNRAKVSFVSSLEYYVHECLSDSLLARTVVHETSDDQTEIVTVSKNKFSLSTRQSFLSNVKLIRKNNDY